LINENNKKNEIINKINKLIDQEKSKLYYIDNNDIILQFQEYNDNMIQYTNYTNSCNELKLQNIHLENNNIQINIILNKLLDEINDYNQYSEKIKINNNINNEINTIKNINLDLQNQIKQKNNEILIEINNKNNINDTINKINDINNILINIKKETDIYDILTKICGRDGVQLYLLNEFLDNISNKVNNILEPYIGKTIKLFLNNDIIELLIISNDGNIIHTLSGMESFLVDLSFCIIVGLFSYIPKASILFIDESISVLDKHHLSSINELFLFIRQYYKNLYIITHLKTIKDYTHYNLNISKKENLSYISNQIINHIKI
jgi:DNA repair exonuclease SbcCD ATPase subunit